MGNALSIRQLDAGDATLVLPLICELNPDIAAPILQSRLDEMFGHENYVCFGAFDGADLVAISGAWLTTRLYSGKQCELDNVIVTGDYRGQGIGARLTDHIEQWACSQGCLTLELNSYVTNSPSHRFYFQRGLKILGYHFYKSLNTTS